MQQLSEKQQWRIANPLKAKQEKNRLRKARRQTRKILLKTIRLAERQKIKNHRQFDRELQKFQATHKAIQGWNRKTETIKISETESITVQLPKEMQAIYAAIDQHYQATAA